MSNSLKNQCFILFSREVDRTALKFQKKLEGTCDFFMLTYADAEKEFLGKDKGVNRAIYSRQSLATTFSDSKPKFHDDGWTIMPGNLDLCQLKFISDHPGYDYYWFCEDDVRYTGDIAALISRFALHSEDLLATNYRTILQGWRHKRSFKSPVYEEIPTKSVFLPFFRLSKSGADALKDAYKAGWSGHHEISWPAILTYYEKTIADINSFEPKCYSSTPSKMGMGPGSFVYEPSKLTAGLQKNMLYHPVKPFPEYQRRTRKRILSIIKNTFN